MNSKLLLPSTSSEISAQLFQPSKCGFPFGILPCLCTTQEPAKNLTRLYKAKLGASVVSSFLGCAPTPVCSCQECPEVTWLLGLVRLPPSVSFPVSHMRNSPSDVALTQCASLLLMAGPLPLACISAGFSACQ